jgi:alpha-tubulin suppressor-like RCC1 family protein
MQLLSTRLQHPQFPQEELESNPRAYEGGLVYTFGKRDYQVRMITVLHGPGCCKVLIIVDFVACETFQLGYHLPNADMQVSPRLVELPVRSTIVQVSASKYHTIALNGTGECFVWGFGKGGRLGTGNEFE